MRYFKFFKAILTITLIYFSIKAILHNKKPQKKENGTLENLRNFYIAKNSNFELKNAKILNMTNNIGDNDLYENRDVLVILIQVHDRLENLKILVDSLRYTSNISHAIIIFSHDYVDYSGRIERCIEKVDFAAYGQIYYPYSIQFFKDEFPNQDPNDCPRDLPKNNSLKCNNINFKDSYGHYRESNIVQIKHHWFWKLSFVFEKIKLFQHVNNLNVLLLEEDHYIMPDTLHVLNLLKDKKSQKNQILTLGYKVLEESYGLDKKMLDTFSISKWHSPWHNSGLVFNKFLWEELKKCSNHFCKYDDYNWDWSLESIQTNCYKNHMQSVHVIASRVIHLGLCGVHVKSKICDPVQKLNILRKFQNENKNRYYPTKLNYIETTDDYKIGNLTRNGGFADPRDHYLCTSFANNSTNIEDFSIFKRLIL